MQMLHQLCLLIKDFFVTCPATYAECHFRLLQVTHILLTTQKPGNRSLRLLCWKPLLEMFSSMAEACLQHPDIFARLLDCCFPARQQGPGRAGWGTQHEHQLLPQLEEGWALPAPLPLPRGTRAANPTQQELPVVTKESGTPATESQNHRITEW